MYWGCSSVGRAPRSQRGGKGFESPQLHQLFHTNYSPAQDLKDDNQDTNKFQISGFQPDWFPKTVVKPPILEAFLFYTFKLSLEKGNKRTILEVL